LNSGAVRNVFEELYRGLRRRAGELGIRLREQPLDHETPGAFDGLSITLNMGWPIGERSYYLAHALGSIAQWSTAPEWSKGVFDELDAAKAEKASERARRENAIERYRAFEEGSSEFAVWLLADIGFSGVIPAYTDFMRADIEAMAEFHRTGSAPVWREHYAAWQEQRRRSGLSARPYVPKTMPRFKPQPMRHEEVKQETDAEPHDWR